MNKVLYESKDDAGVLFNATRGHNLKAFKGNEHQS
jgi:hypothetical protein